MTAQDMDFWWSVEGDWVEEPNNRRGGFSGVQRVTLAGEGGCFYVKRQRGHLFRSVRYPTGRPTLLREWRSMRLCRKLHVPTAELVFFGMRKGPQGWESILVTRGLEGYLSLDQGLVPGVWSPDQRRAALATVAATLVRLHRARRKHGHLYPKEVFVNLAQATPAVAIVDWELSRYKLTPASAAAPDVKRLLKCLREGGVSAGELAVFTRAYQEQGIALPPIVS
jgi:hypothetical protein